MTQLAFPMLNKRWRYGEQRWRDSSDRFQPNRHGVEPIAERLARAFVLEHHYAHSFPAARACIGLYRYSAAAAVLAGVAVFSVPMNQHTIRKYTGAAPNEGAELGRFVCLDEVEGNGESWFLARAFTVLREVKPEIRGIVSYADPLERYDFHTNALLKRAHYGVIYQASNAAFLGRSSRRRITFLPNGTIASARALSKIRNEERGWRYAQHQLLDAGLDARNEHESHRAWLDRVLPTCTHVIHPGNFVYAFGLDVQTRKHLSAAQTAPYPKASRDSA